MIRLVLQGAHVPSVPMTSPCAKLGLPCPSPRRRRSTMAASTAGRCCVPAGSAPISASACFVAEIAAIVEFFHSTVLPSDVSRRARRTPDRHRPEGSHQLALAMADADDP